MRKIAALAALLVLAGCSSTQAVGTAVSPEPMPVVETPTAPAIVAFGTPHAFSNATSVSMTAEPFTPKGKYPGYPGPYVVLHVEVRNGGDQVVSTFFLSDVTAAGQPATTVTLGGETAITEAEGDLLPGQAQRFDQVVAVPDADGELVVKALEPLPNDASTAYREAAYFRGSAS